MKPLKINIPWWSLKPGDRLVCNKDKVIIVAGIDLFGRIWCHEGEVWHPRSQTGHVMVIRNPHSPMEPYGRFPNVLQIHFEDRSLEAVDGAA